MVHEYESASIRILDALHQAERDLIGSRVRTFSGLRGIVEAVRLDEHHGLQFTIESHHPHTPRRWLPVSTIKVHEGPSGRR